MKLPISLEEHFWWKFTDGVLFASAMFALWGLYGFGAAAIGFLYGIWNYTDGFVRRGWYT